MRPENTTGLTRCSDDFADWGRAGNQPCASHVHQLLQRLLATPHSGEDHLAHLTVRRGQRRLGDGEQNVLLARHPLEGVDQLVRHLLLGACADPVHRGDQQVHQRVRDLALPLHQQRGQQGHGRLVRPAAQVRRRFDGRPLPPGCQHLRRYVREQRWGQADRPDRGQLADLPQHRLQADVARHRLDQGQHRLAGLCLGAVLVLLGIVSGGDQGEDPGLHLRRQPGRDACEPGLLRDVQGGSDHPGDPIQRRRLDELRTAVLQQLLAHTVGIALRVCDVGRQPGRQLLRLLHRAHPEPQVLAHLGTVVLDCAAGPLVRNRTPQPTPSSAWKRRRPPHPGTPPGPGGNRPCFV